MDLDYAPIALYPDQAVALALLAGEAVTNALKYYGCGAGEQAWIKVRLEQVDAGTARFTAENSCGDQEVAAGEGGGLGTSLIEAFAHQLRGRAEVARLDRVFRLCVVFPIAEFAG